MNMKLPDLLAANLTVLRGKKGAVYENAAKTIDYLIAQIASLEARCAQQDALMADKDSQLADHMRTHDNMSAALRAWTDAADRNDANASTASLTTTGGGTKTDPPLSPVPVPTADQIALAVAAERERCAKATETIDLVPHPEAMCRMNAWEGLSWGRQDAASKIRGGARPANATKMQT
jgi:uncharacterized coiled-coil protein SlyX